jgi:hypothetical protein
VFFANTDISIHCMDVKRRLQSAWRYAMSDTGRRLLLSCGVILLVICLCLSVIAIGAAVSTALGLGNQVHIPLFSTPTPVGDLAPADIQAQMDEIQTQVIGLRGLQPTGPVPNTLLTPEELRQKVTEDFFKDYTPEDAHDDAIALAVFGLLSPDFDLQGFYTDLYSEQVAGYYDYEAKEMYVVKGEGFQGPERFTYAHEYTHVLQDQVYDIENGLGKNEESCKADSERCAAITALLEGDATMVQLAWFSQYATNEDRKQLTDYFNTTQSPVFDSAPAFMQEDMMFPYDAGYQFVQYLYDQNGWEAVDAAYKNLPVSTEQILHPERYPADKPWEVNLPDYQAALGDGWRELDRNVMGEWYTYLILGQGIDQNARLDKGVAQKAAEGWGGDAYTVYYNDQTNETVMVLRWQWESEGEANEFVNAFTEYADARFGVPAVQQGSRMDWDFSGGYSILGHDLDLTTWVYAPDATTAESIYMATTAP